MITALLTLTALAGEFDHGYQALDRFYGDAVSTTGVDYADLKTRRADLDAALAAIAAADTAQFTKEQRLALAVNAYNGYTLATVLDAMPIASIMELDGGKVWDTRTFVVGGESFTLNRLENERVRTFGDARVHAVVNCASKGCPPLPPDPLRADTLETQLAAAAAAWIATTAYAIDGKTVHLSAVFDWYAADFERYRKGDIPGVDGPHEAALWFLAGLVDPKTAKTLTAGGMSTDQAPYDWALNAR